ncbi:MAG: DUF4143 domain-containing protein [Bifidobacteriaceae bacterium]|nr:DUF4143 domain-containing protein [Bifidobacteriaceae bacterium]
MDTKAVLGHSYRPRVIDPLVTEALSTSGAVLIEGPRACGKTMTAMNAASSYAFLDDPATAQIAAISPAAVLDGASPRLLDEWQLAPDLWNLVRRRVDAAPRKGLFLLTGSAVPADDATRHTGAGRILRLRERTSTWAEKSVPHAPAGVSLTGLFNNGLPRADLSDAMTYQDVVEQLLRPGFPAMTTLAPERAFRLLRAYIDEVARADVPRLADGRREPAVVARVIAAVARSVASEVSYTTLAADVGEVSPSIKPETAAEYVRLLERLFVVETQPAWTPRLRSRARLRRSAKVHLADPALAAAALGAGRERLQRDPATVGLLFESAVFHDLSVFAELLGGEVRHYRDSNGHEIDAVVALPDGRWAAVEVKLGGGQAPPAAESLARAVAQIDPVAAGEPAFRLIVTGTGQTYVMGDGTITCPLRALRP